MKAKLLTGFVKFQTGFVNFQTELLWNQNRQRQNLTSVELIHSKEGFWAAMATIQDNVADFAPLTGSVYHTALETMQLVGDFETFVGEKLIAREVGPPRDSPYCNQPL